MVLLLDIGNTNIKIGVLENGKIVTTWRIASDHNKTADEFGMVFMDLMSSKGYTFDMVDGIIISSVAPALNYTIEHMCRYYTHKKPIMVNSSINLGIKIKYTVPEELGADRIVNAVGAYYEYGGPCVGAIAPGIKSSAEALTNTAAKLPRIELVRPKSIIGKTTVQNMQAGIIYGFQGLVDGIITEMIAESGLKNVKVVATGGMSELVSGGNRVKFDIVDRALSLKGLKRIYELNK